MMRARAQSEQLYTLFLLPHPFLLDESLSAHSGVQNSLGKKTKRVEMKRAEASFFSGQA